MNDDGVQGMQRAGEILKDTFKLASYRQPQAEVVSHVLKGGSGLVLLPTGGGKSLCYQLPALIKPGVCLVISPLLSLMEDQVQALRSKGIDARHWSSMNDASINKSILKDLQSTQPKTKLLYITPERLAKPEFIKVMQDLSNRHQLSLLAVDEAHCISSYGHDFRGDYRKLGSIRDHFPTLPILALTATATQKVTRDILTQLRIENAQIFKSSFNRPNVHLSVIYKTTLADPMERLANLIKKNIGIKATEGSCIVYAWKQATCNEVAEELNRKGIMALAYHAGVGASKRQQVQTSFLSGQTKVVVATISFGMGIDKADVRLVVHWNLSGSLENFYQEMGRAGRDDQPAASVLFYDRSDSKAKSFVIGKEEGGGGQQQEKKMERRMQKLEDMVHYCELSDSCRRMHLLRHFGETYKRPEGWDYKRLCCDYCVDGGDTVRGRLQHMIQGGMRSGGRGFHNSRGGGGGGVPGVFEGDGFDQGKGIENDDDEDEEEDQDEKEDAAVDAAAFTNGEKFKKRLMCAQKPGMSQHDKARAVLKTFVAAEEEEEEEGGGEEEQEEGRAKLKAMMKQAKIRSGGAAGPSRPMHIVPKLGPNGRGAGQQPILGLKRPRPMMTITSGAGRSVGNLPSFSSSSSSSSSSNALKKRPSLDPALADYEAMDEEDGNSLGLSTERRRKIIKSIYEASTDDEIGKKEKEEALRQIRQTESEWYTSAKTKEEYQKMAKAFSERLYGN